jgi:hypothetical protein
VVAVEPAVVDGPARLRLRGAECGEQSEDQECLGERANDYRGRLAGMPGGESPGSLADYRASNARCGMGSGCRRTPPCSAS